MRRLLILALALLAGGFLAWYFHRDPTEVAGYQGYVEGDLLQVGPDQVGRIERLLVEPGDGVSEGQLLFTLEAAEQKAQVHEARARLMQAKAQLENLRAAEQRPEQVAVLEATRSRAEAVFELSRSELDRQRILFERGSSSKARLDQAEAAFDRDKATLEEVQRQIKAAQLSGRTSEIAAGEAAVQAADAALQQAQTRFAKREIFAPAKARVQDVYYRTGEVVNEGYPVLSLLPPDRLKIRFYVPEPMLATLSLGQTIAVLCDRCPQDLRARITFLSQEAEYTPPVIFSDQEKAKLVFRAEARPLTPITLPLGLPITVRPREAEAVASAKP